MSSTTHHQFYRTHKAESIITPNNNYKTAYGSFTYDITFKIEEHETTDNALIKFGLNAINIWRFSPHVNKTTGKCEKRKKIMGRKKGRGKTV